MSDRIPASAVVVAVDSSEGADRALSWAAEQARLEHRPLVVATVADERRIGADDWPDAAPAARGLLLGRLREEAEARVRDAARTAVARAGGLDARTLVEQGDPRDVLVALSQQAHLLVLGSRGRGPVRSLVLGSVSADVCRRTSCPVVVHRPRPAGPAESPGAGVVVGADGSPESRPVLEFAFAQAELRRRPLTVVHAFWDAVSAVAGDGADEHEPRQDDLRAALATSLAGLAERHPDVTVHRRLAHGLVDQVLLDDRSRWDLVVVGRHPWTTARRCLSGSIALAVLERARTSVAVVPEPASADRSVRTGPDPAG